MALLKIAEDLNSPVKRTNHVVSATAGAWIELICTASVCAWPD